MGVYVMTSTELAALAASALGIHPECVSHVAMVVTVCHPGNRAMCGDHIFFSEDPCTGVEALARGMLKSARLYAPQVGIECAAQAIETLGKPAPLAAMNRTYDVLTLLASAIKDH